MRNKMLVLMLTIIIVITLVVVNKGYTIKDYDYLSNLILSEREPTKKDLNKYDFNNDGVLNSSDYVALANILKR